MQSTEIRRGNGEGIDERKQGIEKGTRELPSLLSSHPGSGLVLLVAPTSQDPLLGWWQQKPPLTKFAAQVSESWGPSKKKKGARMKGCRPLCTKIIVQQVA